MVAPIVCVNGSIAGRQEGQGKAAATLPASCSCCTAAGTRCPPAAVFTCPCSFCHHALASRWTAWRSPSRACGATLPACAPGAPTPPCWTESRWVLPGCCLLLPGAAYCRVLLLCCFCRCRCASGQLRHTSDAGQVATRPRPARFKSAAAAPRCRCHWSAPSLWPSFITALTSAPPPPLFLPLSLTITAPRRRCARWPTSVPRSPRCWWFRWVLLAGRKTTCFDRWAAADCMGLAAVCAGATGGRCCIERPFRIDGCMPATAAPHSCSRLHKCC